MRDSLLLRLALHGTALMTVAAACAEQQEPRPAPIVARRTGGDSLEPGPMVIVCRADDESCIPSYAVACDYWAGDSAPPPDLPKPSAQDETWCAAQPLPDSSAR